MEQSYQLPPPERLREIEARQNEAERKVLDRRRTERAALAGQQREQQQQHQQQHQGAESRADLRVERDAARLIQRNYRGYRSRREQRGHDLTPGKRWTEALKTAQYLNSTTPKPLSETTNNEKSPSSPAGSTPQSAKARSAWRRVGLITAQAVSDDTSSTSGEEGMTPDELAEHKRRKAAKKAEREKYAKTMGLEYFLEMVDRKHRYGSSLRAYHAVWQESDTKENFFYWLDEGEGKEVNLEEQGRSRERLEREQIRYLSREERGRYMVLIGKDGLFRWAKNGELVTTSVDFRDSVNGIVPTGDKTPTWTESKEGKKVNEESEDDDDDDDDSSDAPSGLSTGSQEDDSKYVNQEFRDAKGLAKLKHINTSALMNSLLRKTTKKNTWIFVADTSFRIFIGIKQSGAFQHSSFLHGARISAAGLIKVKRGQLRKLDPLSGHYAPPAENFKGFVKSLREEGADLSRVSISRSYAILLGLEGWIGAKKRVKMGEEKAKRVVGLGIRGDKGEEKKVQDSKEQEDAHTKALHTESRSGKA